MDFALIPPNALRGVWDFVKQGLASMPAEDWIAEDVYHAIKSGDAALHLAIDDTGPCGFLVLQKRTTEFTHETFLHVWLAYNHGERDVIEAGEQLLHAVAQHMNASRIRFGSPRKGWAKRYTPVSTTYEIPRAP